MRRADTEPPFVSGGEEEEARFSNGISGRNWRYLHLAQMKEMRKQIKTKEEFKLQQNIEIGFLSMTGSIFAICSCPIFYPHSQAPWGPPDHEHHR